MTSEIKQLGMLGFGRFGQTFARLLSTQFQIHVYDPEAKEASNNKIIFDELASVAQQSTIIIATPIRLFSSVIAELSPLLKNPTTIIDVCSVKTYPVEVMLSGLPAHADIIATHPMFGPDSVNADKRPIVMHAVRDTMGHYAGWCECFTNLGLDVVEMTPEQHDRQAAYSQNVTHVIGRLLETMRIKSTSLDTQSFERLLAVMNQTCNDSDTLFQDLLKYNPYSQEMLDSMSTALTKVREGLGV